MFWIICIIIGILDFILMKLIIKQASNDLFDEEDIFLPMLFIIGPFIPVLNWILFLIFSIYFISEIKWYKIFYKIYGKK